MRFFQARRIRAIIITAFLGLCFSAIVVAWKTSLIPTAHLTGWSLLVLVLFLALYNARKKLTYPPLFKASSWMQLHIYAGFLALLGFLTHTNLNLPNGQFETVLYSVFMVIALSGVIGLYLSRSIPARLTDRGQEVIFERIPQFTRQLREQSKTLILQAVASEDSTLLEQFYQDKMQTFMSGPQHFWRHLFNSSRKQNILQQALLSQYRYLNDKETEIAEQLVIIIKQKQDLDFHYALQKTLKLWLFVHIPLTFSLLILLVVHLILVFSF